MPRYRKKPVVIEATQFEWEAGRGIPDIPGVKFREWRDVAVAGFGTKISPLWDTAYIETLQGPLQVSRGDWIITGIKGERYPCKPDIFAATYEAVEE